MAIDPQPSLPDNCGVDNIYCPVTRQLRPLASEQRGRGLGLLAPLPLPRLPGEGSGGGGYRLP